jgi:hypothetical protein
MPVLMILTATLLPGNEDRATIVPVEMPRNRLISVADPETCRDRKVMRITSGSPVTSSQNAFFTPSRIKSIANSNSKSRVPACG